MDFKIINQQKENLYISLLHIYKTDMKTYKYLWAGRGIISLSVNKRVKKGSTSAKVAGPPIFNIKMPVFGFLKIQ